NVTSRNSSSLGRKKNHPIMLLTKTTLLPSATLAAHHLILSCVAAGRSLVLGALLVHEGARLAAATTSQISTIHGETTTAPKHPHERWPSHMWVTLTTAKSANKTQAVRRAATG